MAALNDSSVCKRRRLETHAGSAHAPSGRHTRGAARGAEHALVLAVNSTLSVFRDGGGGLGEAALKLMISRAITHAARHNLALQAASPPPCLELEVEADRLRRQTGQKHAVTDRQSWVVVSFGLAPGSPSLVWLQLPIDNGAQPPLGNAEMRTQRVFTPSL